MDYRRIAATVAAVTLLTVGAALAQSQCEHPIACNATISADLDYVASNSCWDSSLLTYDTYLFTGSVGESVSATARSAFFAPLLTLVGPDGRTYAADANGASTGSASISATLPLAQTWYLIVKNKNLTGDGPYSLMLSCTPVSSPPPPQQPGAALSITPASVTMSRSDSRSFAVTVVPAGGLADTFDIAFSGLPGWLTVDPPSLTLQTNATGSVKVTASNDASGGTFALIGRGAGRTSHVSIVGGTQVIVDAPCLPPFLLAQPTTFYVKSGEGALLHVEPSGSAPFTFQWYSGFRGSEYGLIQGANARALLTPPLAAEAQYWVRVFNACGSADSATFTINVLPNVKHRAAGH